MERLLLQEQRGGLRWSVPLGAKGDCHFLLTVIPLLRSQTAQVVDLPQQGQAAVPLALKVRVA